MNYYVLVPPPAGQRYLDPVFGTAIRRISDARRQPDSSGTGRLDFIVHEVYTLSGLAPGEHTRDIEVTGRHHPRSLGKWISVDAFETSPE